MKLQEKLERLYVSYASSLELGDNFAMVTNAEYDELAKVLLGAHADYLRQRDVDYLTFFALFEVELLFKERTGRLASPVNADIFDAVVKKLNETFGSLPRKYVLCVELPAFPNVGEYEIEISEGLKLCAAKHKFHIYQPHLYPIAAAVVITGLAGEHKTFLKFEFEGYSGTSASSPPIDACLSKIKQLSFVLCAHAVWRRASQRGALARATLTTDGKERSKDVELPHELAKMCGVLIPHPDSLKVRVPSAKGGLLILLGGEEKSAETDSEKIEAIKNKTHDGSRFFSRQTHEDFASISAAMEWYQDSVDSGNQTFAYLAACIGLEALLGSPNEQLDSLSKRLEDRYAFLLGTGRTERERLRTQYRDILNLRGKLVHAREPKLKAAYQQTLHDAQNMLLKATWKELHNMYRSK